MALVAYSDSEGSDSETSTPPVHIPEVVSTTSSHTRPSSSTNNFSIDKSNPGKIRVNLQSLAKSGANGDNHDDSEPAAKRPRLGNGERGGAFSGFNAMLPAPKRDAEKPSQSQGAVKAPARKVFSLKTGAEPGFSRESDAELKDFFAEQDRLVRSDGPASSSAQNEEDDIPPVPKNKDAPPQASVPVKGSAFMFKPLSVSRNKTKQKTSATNSEAMASTISKEARETRPIEALKPVLSEPQKVDLFSISNAQELPLDIPDTIQHEPDDEMSDQLHDYGEDPGLPSFPAESSRSNNESQSLNTIANDLGLSAAERRQLLGRNGKAGEQAINIVNFNTDQEYAANEAFRASGEQVQHNPVRAIAPGKHSLKQLVSAASGQKDALEESFASGRRNRKEAGNKYGW